MVRDEKMEESLTMWREMDEARNSRTAETVKKFGELGLSKFGTGKEQRSCKFEMQQSFSLCRREKGR